MHAYKNDTQVYYSVGVPLKCQFCKASCFSDRTSIEQPFMHRERHETEIIERLEPGLVHKNISTQKRK